MAEDTAIEWAHHTFNPWWVCEEVSVACDECYARELAKRFGWAWGPDAPRRFFGNNHWSLPLKWDTRAKYRGESYRVFCASMADVFDNNPTVAPHRQRLWDTVAVTHNLFWLFLTKRIGNAKRMVPNDWGPGYPNVAIGATVVTQAEVDRDLPKLGALPAAVRFLSCEPLREDIDLRPYLHFLDWVIVGGESGRRARPTVIGHIRGVVEQCLAANVAVFVKQLGKKPVNREGVPHPLHHGKGGEISEWPSDLRIRQFPRQFIEAKAA